MGMVHLIPPYGVESNPAQEGTQENYPWAISLSVCRLPVKRSIGEYVDDPAQYWQYLSEMLSHLGTVSSRYGPGFHLSRRLRVKQDLLMRRITLLTTGAVFTLRLVRHALHDCAHRCGRKSSLRQWGGRLTPWPTSLAAMPCSGIGLRLAFGRPPLVGTTVKEPQTLPRALVADEKLTQVAKQQVYVPTTVGGGCCLGVSVVEAADMVDRREG